MLHITAIHRLTAGRRPVKPLHPSTALTCGPHSPRDAWHSEAASSTLAALSRACCPNPPGPLQADGFGTLSFVFCHSSFVPGPCSGESRIRRPLLFFRRPTLSTTMRSLLKAAALWQAAVAGAFYIPESNAENTPTLDVSTIAGSIGTCFADSPFVSSC